MVRGAVVPQPPVPLIWYLVGEVVRGAVGQDIPEHTMQPFRAAGCWLLHDDILTDRVIAWTGWVPITSRYSIPVPG
jgi:hypothetical protein